VSCKYIVKVSPRCARRIHGGARVNFLRSIDNKCYIQGCELFKVHELYEEMQYTVKVWRVHAEHLFSDQNITTTYSAETFLSS